jgi:hypothetical protein
MSDQQAAGEAGDGAKRRETVEGLSTWRGELGQQGGHLVLAPVEREGEDDSPVRHELLLEVAGVLFGVGEPPFGDAAEEAAVLVMLDEAAQQGQQLPAIVRERRLEIAAPLELMRAGRDVDDDMPEVGIAPEAANDPQGGQIGGGQEGRPGAEAGSSRPEAYHAGRFGTYRRQASG